ncbi:hypothetical protein V3G39_18000 (plasmid) [Dermatophilaceae bacterium Sec6.4]
MSITRYTMSAAAGAVVVAAALTGCAGKTSAGPSTVTVTASRTTSSSSTSSSRTPQIPTATIAPGTAGTPRGGAPALAKVNAQNASAVAAAVMRVFATRDTALDTTPLDAERRAMPLLGAPLAAAVNAPIGGNGGGGPAWSALTAHHGWTTATAKVIPLQGVADQSGDSPTLAVRQVEVATTRHGTGGWSTTAAIALWVVTCSRASKNAPWRVTAVYEQTP